MTTFDPLALYPDYDPDLHIIITLTRGQYTIVNAIDGDLAKIKWYAHCKRNGNFDARNQCLGILHRIVLGRKLDRPLLACEQVDHRNRNQLDNRRCNLRPSSPSQNAQNRGKSAGHTSPYVGVTWDAESKRWRARIKINGKTKYLGRFKNPEEARRIYCRAAIETFGEFAPQEVVDFLAVHNE